ncbi:MAG: phosphoglucosamine mutase [Candidatus Methanomethylophilaceae archaeon]|jgi:phosphomannomutase/phosphoglucomutase
MAARLFGTNGVRGIVNESLTSDMAMQLGKAIGKIVGGTVATATDTRSSGDMLRTAVSAGLMAVGANVLYLGTVPTPALQYYVKTHDDVSGGIMITASHNPPQFNGIKFISGDGTEASREEETHIEEAYETEIPTVAWDETGTMDHVNGAGEAYIDAVISNVDAELIRKSKLTACLDCANGAGYKTAPLLLKKLNVKTVTLNCNAQGEAPGRPSEPTEENLADLIYLVKKKKVSLGIAHDGDADRCVFIADGGKYVSGDKSLALLAKAELAKGKGKVVTPVSSSSLVEEVVTDAGGILKYTAVGSPVVARKMKEYDAIFGGEENGGLIFPDMQYCRDGAMTAAKMLETIARNGSLSKQLKLLPVYYTQKRKLECPDNMKQAVINYLKKSVGDIKTDTTDGLKIIYDDGWVLARPSGTEPIFRIYSESKDEAVSVERANEYETRVAKFLDPDAVLDLPEPNQQ